MIQTKASAVPSRFSSSYYSACKMAVKMPHLNTSQTSLKLAGWKKKWIYLLSLSKGPDAISPLGDYKSQRTMVKLTRIHCETEIEIIWNKNYQTHLYISVLLQ